MKIVLFGATGMDGQGVQRECLLDPDVAQVLAVGRAMLQVAKQAAPQRIFERADINRV